MAAGHVSEYALLLYIVLTISVLIGQEPPAYFENSCDFVNKHDYSVICYPILLYIRLTMKNLIGREHSINSQ